MTVYFDTSSLVKLYIAEPGSEAVADLVARADMLTTSSVAYPESRAAFARLRRVGDISRADTSQLAERLDRDWHRFATLEVTDVLAHRAGRLADRFDLRGFDAIHLASFELLLERADDEDVRFSSADDRLTRAAKRLGFA